MRYLTRAADAYAAGNDRLGAQLFDRAHDEILPLVRRIVDHNVGSIPRIDAEGVVQDVLIAVWSDVTRGKEPVVSMVATNISIDVFRREVARKGRDGKQLPRPQFHHLDASRDEAPETAGWTPREPDHADASLDAIVMAKLAQQLGAIKPVWGLMALAGAAGLADAREIADHLNRPRGTIRREICELRAHLEGEAA